MESSAGRAEDSRYGSEWLVRMSRLLDPIIVDSSTLRYRKNFVCVEPGHARGFIALKPQETWIGQQVISVVNERNEG